MAGAQVVDVKPKVNGMVPPVVLIVRSPHLEPRETEQEMEAMLDEYDNTTYIRSAFMSIIAGMYSPVNVYLDGVETKLSKYTNVLLEQLVECHKQFDLEAGSQQQRHIPGPDKFRELLLPKEPVRIDLKPEFLKKYGQVVPKQSFPLADYDFSRLIHMLSIPASYGANITIRPGDIHANSLFRIMQAEQEADDKNFELFQDIRDSNLYYLVLHDIWQDSSKNAIVYFGLKHQMREFTQVPLSVFWINIDKTAEGVVNVKGTLPYAEGYQDPRVCLECVTKFLSSGPIEVQTDITMMRV